MNNADLNTIMVYVTTSNRGEAEAIAEALVQDRLAACVNVLGPIRSIYRWQGQVEKADETVLIAKTRAELFDEVRAKVKSMHSYDVPCIVAYPMVNGYGPYLEWIDAETGG
ncbi:MAG: divalent-cation tolerance protein CutA [Rhodospirillaceae bacterium]|nr:divalent-cation tolerance protein CutA [Rhodospirillaceae bacterium]